MDYIGYLREQEQVQEAQPKRKRDLWAMLSTMKFAIWILIALGVMSLVSMFVGELWNPETARRGATNSFEALLKLFQMEDPFRSWWYRLLLALLNLSLFACVLKRTPVIWKLWNSTPPEPKEVSGLKSENMLFRRVQINREDLLHKLGMWKFRVKTNDYWVGERSRLGMWGPLLTHVGLLLIGIGALIGSFGGITERAGGYAGDTVRLEGMPFSVQIDSFRIHYYPLQPGQWVLVDNQWVGKLNQKHDDGSWLVEHAASDPEDNDTELSTVEPGRIVNHFDGDLDRSNIERYASYVTVMENGSAVEKTVIAVNSPLRRSGYRFYQSSYDPDNPQVGASYQSISIGITDSSGKILNTVTLKPNVEQAIPGDTIMVTAGDLLPDFKIGQNFEPYSASENFANPAVQVSVRGQKGYKGSQWVFQKVRQTAGGSKFNFQIAALNGEHATTELRTIWEVKKTHGSMILWAGFLFGSLGLLLSFYATHRILYIQWPTTERAETLLTGMSRKTPHLFARELDRITQD